METTDHTVGTNQEGDIPWYRIQKETNDTILIAVGGFLALIGTFWVLYAMGAVVRDVRILSNYNNYTSTTAVVEEVSWSDGPEYYYFGGDITVNGKKERAPFGEFAGINPNLLFSSGNKWPRSQAAAENLLPVGSVLTVMYDPKQQTRWFMGNSLRVLPYHSNFKTRYQRAITRNTILAVWPLLTGLLLLSLGYHMRRTRMLPENREYETQNKSIQATPEGAPD